jgi:hypothetical protein
VALAVGITQMPVVFQCLQGVHSQRFDFWDQHIRLMFVHNSL